MLTAITLYCLLGAVAGILAGLLGVGGGIVIVPMLLFAFTWQGMPQDSLMLMALGTSMGSILFTSISSTLAHNRVKGVEWRVVRAISPGILIGTFCGSFAASHIPARVLQLFFVAFLAFVVTQMIGGKKPKPSRHLPGFMGLSCAGGVIGTVSSLVGIGGGTLSVPFLLWNNVDIRKAIGTSAAIGFFIALAGCVGYVANGWRAPALPAYSFGYSYVPALSAIVAVSLFTAPIGVRLAQTLPVRKLKMCFAGLLIVVGTRMLINVL